ncbi:MAG: response regulator [Candidatus Margulisiibacteriota bacterium]
MANPVVMVVDDEVDVANSIANIIKDTSQYEVITAYSAKEALENLTKNKVLFGLGGNKIRFIFLDIKMPEMDGLSFLEKIRHEFGETIGVSMLTAWEDAEKWEKATSGFVVNYIRKPFKSEDLLKTLNQFFSGGQDQMVLKTFERHIAKKDEFGDKS